MSCAARDKMASLLRGLIGSGAQQVEPSSIETVTNALIFAGYIHIQFFVSGCKLSVQY